MPRASAKKTPSKNPSLPPDDPAALNLFTGFGDVTFDFLAGLAENNTTDWFNQHRDDYERGYVEPAKAFVSALGPRLSAISSTICYEPRINGSIFRIQRDTRFSKDKSPYKAHLDLWFWQGDRRGWNSSGFFFRMFADRVILGAGMHQFEKPALDRFRTAVQDPTAGKALDAALAKVRSSGAYVIGGNTRQTIPRGFDATHERASYFLFEGLHAILEAPLVPEARTAAFVDWCVGHFQATWPVSRWLLAHL
jgi:uncharacterized protein (TIGR02453 family)